MMFGLNDLLKSREDIITDIWFFSLALYRTFLRLHYVEIESETVDAVFLTEITACIPLKILLTLF